MEFLDFFIGEVVHIETDGIKWIPVEDGYPDNPRQVLCTIKYDYDSGPEYEIFIGEYWGFSEELKKDHPEECGFGRMSDFYDLLLEQPEEEAKDIALSFELFVSGSLNIFNHQTNVDVDN